MELSQGPNERWGPQLGLDKWAWTRSENHKSLGQENWQDLQLAGWWRVGKLPLCGMGINVGVLSECGKSRIQEGFLEEVDQVVVQNVSERASFS